MPATVAVTWSSPDGKNNFASSDSFGRHGSPGQYTTTLGAAVGIYRQGQTRGPAVIIADVSAPLDLRATFAVVDRAGIGFGCYFFMVHGPSVRIANGEASKTALANADVAVAGPSGRGDFGPDDGCTGENRDDTATGYRLVFGRGGRVLRNGSPSTFVETLPFDAIDDAHPLDVRASHGRTYRRRVSDGAGTYLTGWMEPLDAQDQPLADNQAVLAF